MPWRENELLPIQKTLKTANRTHFHENIKPQF